MQFLVLAYGDESEWQKLSVEEQQALLAQDKVLRDRGALVAAVQPSVTTVKAWDGQPTTEPRPFATSVSPLAGFGVIEAADLDEAIRLVKDTPCARAGGAVEVRPIVAMNATKVPAVG